MAYQGGKLSDGTPLNVAVYRAYRNAGLSHSQALAVTAEVGRENGYNPSILFGSHIDPAGNSGGGSIRNVGMLSWNGNRGKNLEGFLRSRGVLSNQGMARNQDNLNAQAAFSVQEMKSPSFRGGLQNFWSNPNANPDSYARELGKNYIVWAYGQNSIRAKGGGRTAFNWQAHDNRRRGYLNTLSQMAGGQQFSPMPSQYQPPPPDPRMEMDTPTLLAHMRKTNKGASDDQILGTILASGGRASRELKYLLDSGHSREEIAQQLGIKAPAPQVSQKAPPQNPLLALPANEWVAKSRNGKMTDGQVFDNLLQNGGRGANEVQYLLNQGHSREEVAKQLGLNLGVTPVTTPHVQTPHVAPVAVNAPVTNAVNAPIAAPITQGTLLGLNPQNLTDLQNKPLATA